MCMETTNMTRQILRFFETKEEIHIHAHLLSAKIYMRYADE